MIGIYKITSPSNCVYIGQSVNIEARKKHYKKLDCKSQPRIYNSIKKYGWEAHRFEVICECDRDELNRLEKYYVELYQSFNSKYGLNLKEGGDSRGKLSEESIEKIRRARRLQSPPTLGKFYAVKKKKVIRPRGIAWIGKKHTAESRAKQSLSKIGNVCHNKKVIKVETGEIFESVTQAAHSIGIDMKSLSQRIRLGIKKTPIFRYV